MINRSLNNGCSKDTLVVASFILLILVNVVDYLSDETLSEGVYVNSLKIKSNLKTNQITNYLANEAVSFNYKVQPGSTYSESHEFEDDDFGFSGTYPSITSGDYNYKDYQIIQTNQTDFLNITLISPDLPYYLTQKDISVTYSGNFFNVSFYKAKIFPNSNIGIHTKKGLKLSTYSVLIYPIVQINSTLTPLPSMQLPEKEESSNYKENNQISNNSTSETDNDGIKFKTDISPLQSYGSNTKFKVEIQIDKKYFAHHSKWKKLFAERGEFKISHIKSQKHIQEEQSMQADNSNVIIDIYLKNSTSPKGFNHYKNNFDQMKTNILTKGYHPRKPWDLYDLDPDKMDKEFVSHNPFE